ncbi:MAG: YncE family protein [Candidatus Omnitrophica bacterium]|nr:YncE family protein [Candidatus Omnitrophota bacterium]
MAENKEGPSVKNEVAQTSTHYVPEIPGRAFTFEKTGSGGVNEEQFTEKKFKVEINAVKEGSKLSIKAGDNEFQVLPGERVIMHKPAGSNHVTVQEDINHVAYAASGPYFLRGTTHNLLKTFRENPSALAASADGGEVYAISQGGSLAVIDTHAYAIKKRTGLGEGSWNRLAISHDGKTAYVTDSAYDKAAIVNLGTGRVTRTFRSGSMPTAITEGEGVIYIVNRLDRTVSEYDAEGKKLSEFKAGQAPYGAAFSEGKLFVTDAQSDAVLIVDPKTHKELGRIPVGRSPHKILAVAGKLLVGNRGENSLSVIDVKTHKLISKIENVGDPYDFAALPTGGKAYIANLHELLFVDTLKGKTLETIPAAGAKQVVVSSPAIDYDRIAKDLRISKDLL